MTIVSAYDVNDTSLSAQSLAIQASGSIGTDSVDPLTTTVSTLAASAEYGIYVSNTGDLAIGNISELSGLSVGSGGGSQSFSGGNIDVVTTGSLTVNYAVTDSEGGNITLSSQAPLSSESPVNLTIDATITASDGNGNIALSGYDNVNQNSGGNLSASGDGQVSVTATNGPITMDPTATTSTDSGTIDYTAVTNIILGMLSGGLVIVTASNGSITDSSGGSDVNITAVSAALSASEGVGASDDSLETEVSTLAASGGSGGVYVHNTGDMTIGTVGAVSGATASGDDISVINVGSLWVNAAVTNSGSGGNITLLADNNIYQNADISAACAATITLTASVNASGGFIAMVDQTATTAASGDIIYSSPLTLGAGSETVTSTAGGAIAFVGTVDSDSSESANLIVSTSGQIYFDQSVGSNYALASLTVEGAGNGDRRQCYHDRRSDLQHRGDSRHRRHL